MNESSSRQEILPVTDLSVREAPMPPAELAYPAIGQGLLGRRHECGMLERLMAGVRAGRGQVLVLRGEAGAGKTALLNYMLKLAGGCQIIRAAGAESETGTDFEAETGGSRWCHHGAQDRGAMKVYRSRRPAPTQQCGVLW